MTRNSQPHHQKLDISNRRMSNRRMQIEPWIEDRDTPNSSHFNHLTVTISMLQGKSPLFFVILST